MLRVPSRSSNVIRSSLLAKSYATASSPPVSKSYGKKAISVLVGSTILFYGASLPAGLYSLRYRDFLVESVPGGEQLGDLLDTYELSSGAKPTPIIEGAPVTAGKETELTRYAESVAKASGWELKPASTTEVKESKGTVSEVAKARAQDAARAAKLEAGKAEIQVKKAEEKAATKVAVVASSTKVKVAEVIEEVKQAIEPVVEKVEDFTLKVVEQLSVAEIAVEKVLEEMDEPQSAPIVIPVANSNRPRQLDATPIPPKKAKKEIYAGPTLPIGFEPPVGFEVARPPKTPAGELKPVAPLPKPLPLIAPKLKEVVESEPILGQLASSIDSLASYIANNSEDISASAASVLTSAQEDIEKLSKRLEEIKKVEEIKLEETLKNQAAEYSNQLLKAEKELVERLDLQELDWKNAFDMERTHLVEAYKNKLQLELETQQEIINLRLKEEVVSQGIELQRRWVREIKVKVEQERGGRLAKLEELETGIRKLESIASQNQVIQSEALSARKLYTAIKAVQHKIESGFPFDQEIRSLQNLLQNNPNQDTELIQVALATIKDSVAATGIASFPSLSTRFTSSVSPKIRQASLLPANGGIFSYLTSFAFSHILFEKTGWVEGNDVISTIARTEFYLINKDLEGAAKEINTLEGWPKKLALDWLQQARNHLEVKQAFDIAEAQATLAALNAL